MQLLLLSGSYVHGSGYLDHYEETIGNFLHGIHRILFVPYAADVINWDQYTLKVNERFRPLGIKVVGIHEEIMSDTMLVKYGAVFIGGGNTFRLLEQLQKFDLITKLKGAITGNGMRYLGSSAGSNVACHTICTTNDMPIIFPRGGFDAIDLLPFQLNPHYIDPVINSTHMGETRDERIREFHECNSEPVIGLREGAYLHIRDTYEQSGEIYLGGTNGAKFFFQGSEPVNLVSPCFFQLSRNGLIHS